MTRWVIQTGRTGGQFVHTKDFCCGHLLVRAEGGRRKMFCWVWRPYSLYCGFLGSTWVVFSCYSFLWPWQFIIFAWLLYNILSLMKTDVLKLWSRGSLRGHLVHTTVGTTQNQQYSRTCTFLLPHVCESKSSSSKNLKLLLLYYFMYRYISQYYYLFLII